MKVNKFSHLVKVVSLFLTCCIIIAMLFAVPASASKVSAAVAGYWYDASYFTATENPDGSQTLTATAVAPWYVLTTRDDAISAESKGAHFVINNLAVDDSKKYTFLMDFGANWAHDQNFDKGGFLFTYSSDGDLRILSNHSSYIPSAGDTTAVQTTIEPLTTNGFELDLRYANKKVFFRVKSSAGKDHYFIYDLDYSFNNIPTSNTNGSWTVDYKNYFVYAVGLNHALDGYGDAEAGTSFTIKKTDYATKQVSLGGKAIDNFTINDNTAFLTLNSDNSAKVTLSKNFDAYSRFSSGARLVKAEDGTRLSFKNINILRDDNKAYYAYLNLGDTWNQQFFDKTGITVAYGTDGTFKVFSNGNAWNPRAGEANIISDTIEPLTSAGFDIDFSLVDEKYYQITITVGKNKHTYLYDLTYVIDNPSGSAIPLANFKNLYLGMTFTGMGNGGNTLAGSSFDFNAVTPIPNDYNIIPNNVNAAVEGYCYGENDGKIIVNHDNKGATYQRFSISKVDVNGNPIVDSSSGKRILQQYNLLSENGLDVKLSNIGSINSDRFSLIICLTGVTDNRQVNESWWDRGNNLFLIVDQDGDTVLAYADGTTYKLPGTLDIAAYKAGTSDLTSLDVNFKGNETENTLEVTVNGETFNLLDVVVASTVEKLNSWNVCVSFAVSSAFTYNSETGALEGLKSWQNHSDYIHDDGVVSFTIDEIDSGETEVTQIVSETEELSAYVGQMILLAHTVLPEYALDKSLTWTTDDPTVVQIEDQYGDITGLKAGTATVTATSINGVTQEWTVTVYELGDLDQSESIDADDLVIIIKVILGTIEIKSDEQFIYDINGDKAINLLDLVCLKKLL